MIGPIFLKYNLSIDTFLSNIIIDIYFIVTCINLIVLTQKVYKLISTKLKHQHQLKYFN